MRTAPLPATNPWHDSLFLVHVVVTNCKEVNPSSTRANTYVRPSLCFTAALGLSHLCSQPQTREASGIALVPGFPSGGATRSETPVSWPRSTDGVSLATLLLKGVGKPERKQQKRVTPSMGKSLPLTTPAGPSNADHFFFSWLSDRSFLLAHPKRLKVLVTQSAS